VKYSLLIIGMMAMMLIACVEETITVEREYADRDIVDGTTDAGSAADIEVEDDDQVDDVIVGEIIEKNGSDGRSRTTLITLVQDEPQIFSVGDREYTIDLERVDGADAKIALHGVPMTLSRGEDFVSHDYTMSLVGVKEDAVSRSKESWVDMNLGSNWAGVRDTIAVGEQKSYNVGGREAVVEVDFVGLSDGTPTANIVIDGKGMMMIEDDEEYMDNLYVRIRGIYFNDPQEADIRDTAVVRITER